MHLLCCCWSNQEDKHFKIQECSSNLEVFTSTLHCHVPLSASRKCLVLLNEALQVLYMKKVPLMTFFPTCVAYLLTICSQAVHLLLPICDIMTSADLKIEEKSSFKSPKSMIIMYVLADMEELLLKSSYNY